MDEETYQSLKEISAYCHKELNKIKRIKSKFHILVALAEVDKWIYEVAKDYSK